MNSRHPCTQPACSAALLASSVLLTACDDDNSDDVTCTGNTATMRFVNATGQNIDVGTNGTFASGNSNLAFAGSSQWVNVNPSSAGLSFRQNGTTTTFTPSGFNAAGLNAGSRYTAILRPGATAGSYTATTGSGASQSTAFTSTAFPVTANGYQTMVITNDPTTSTTLRSISVAPCK